MSSQQEGQLLQHELPQGQPTPGPAPHSCRIGDLRSGACFLQLRERFAKMTRGKRANKRAGIEHLTWCLVLTRCFVHKRSLPNTNKRS